jgi:hypothetical protein
MDPARLVGLRSEDRLLVVYEGDPWRPERLLLAQVGGSDSTKWVCTRHGDRYTEDHSEFFAIHKWARIARDAGQIVLLRPEDIDAELPALLARARITAGDTDDDGAVVALDAAAVVGPAETEVSWVAMETRGPCVAGRVYEITNKALLHRFGDRAIYCHASGNISLGLLDAVDSKASPNPAADSDAADFRTLPVPESKNVCSICKTFARVPYEKCNICGDSPSYHHSGCCTGPKEKKACVICKHYARVPYNKCIHCKDSPSYHHARCCPKAPKNLKKKNA